MKPIDPRPLDLRQLEQATAPRHAVDSALLDAETAACREAYLALGELLQEAAPDHPPRDALPVEPWQEERSARWATPWLAGLGALAASLLLAGAAVWQLPRPHAAQPVAAEPSARPHPESAAPVAPAPEPASPASRQAEQAEVLAWDDGWDTQLSQTWYDARMLQEGRSAFDTLRDVAQHNVRQLAEELSSSEAL
jgi:hypothetical protein